MSDKVPSITLLTRVISTTCLAGVIVMLLIIGMLPAFLGLLVVLPLLGHATWHLYQRVLRDDK